VIQFGEPLALLALLAVAVRIGLRIADRRRKTGSFLFSSLGLVSSRATFTTSLAWLPFVLELAGWILLVIALARPQRVVMVSNDDRFGVDLVIALDASGSMAAEDFRPRNRFSVAKELLADFILSRTNDRIGIVTFGSRAATRVPVTFDHDIARKILSDAQIGQNGDGTAIGHAIATSVNRLRNSKARSRVIVLVTDGVNNSGSIEPTTAAALASRFGIRIYAIGVGSRGNVPIPVKVQNRYTGEIETVYHIIRADLDEPMLTGISRATGGHYFRAVDPGALEAILDRIDTLEKSRLTAPRRQAIDELYSPPLAAGLSLIATALFFGETLWLKLVS
jgi:Ca-activated chloride channel family protein